MQTSRDIVAVCNKDVCVAGGGDLGSVLMSNLKHPELVPQPQLVKQEVPVFGVKILQKNGANMFFFFYWFTDALKPVRLYSDFCLQKNCKNMLTTSIG